MWAVKLNRLFEEQNVGVLLGTMSLLLGIVSRSYQGYEPCVPKVRPTTTADGGSGGGGGGGCPDEDREVQSTRPLV